MRLVRPSFAALLVAAIAFSDASACDATASRASGEPDRPAIRVVAGDWGRARPVEIEAVLRSAAQVLWRATGQRPSVAIVVEPSAEHPEIDYERNRCGEYVIALSARDRRWAQYAYQFGHELCHVLASFDLRRSAASEPLTRHQWLEETLCEAAALYTLRQMAAAWQSAPPFPHWKDYAPWLAEYANTMLAAEHRRHARLDALPAWYAENAQLLAHEPYARQYNDFCAAALLPLFESDPAAWNALRYMNLDGAPAQPTFRGYLARWRSSVPEPQRQVVVKVMAAFGLRTVEDEIARAPSSGVP